MFDVPNKNIQIKAYLYSNLEFIHKSTPISFGETKAQI